MASEMHLSETISFAPSSRFTKGVSFQALSEISYENQDTRVNGVNTPTNVMVANNGNGTVISKSSSSDSDTNDSATRLLEDSLQDFRSVRYLLLTPPITTTTTSLSDEPTNPSEALWTQMQNSLSKEIRNRYLMKNRFPKAIRRDYSFVGLNCYFSTIKLVFSVTLVIILCTVFLLMMILFVWRNNKFIDENSVSYPSNEHWWQGSTFYEIFPASFKDSDADGFGDFQGLRDKISYLKELGIKAIRLNSIFSALDYPHRYENVLDFYNVDPHLGKLSDFIELVRELKKSGIHVILDINPASTSEQHPWAAHWLLNKSGDYQYFYVNVSDDQINDLDWTSSSATDRLQSEMEESHKYFGGRLFLNWSHPIVRTKMLEVFHFWLQYIDGLYLKHLDRIQIDSEAVLFDILKDVRNLLNTKLTREGMGLSLIHI